ncbi:MAG: flagellar filament capping protein FliD [Deltaproteobacteria bacterium]|nr:flagellar filament capping protein FliD [Deltaproteobacteria bacterium]
MGLSTNLISGLASGFDWRSMIDELMKIERRPVDLIETRKREYEEKLAEWQSVNTKLLSLKTAAEGLKDPEDFNVFTSLMTSDSATVEASDLLSVFTSSTASQGSYSVVVSALATAQKLSSNSFSSFSDALGSAYVGDILINGTVIAISVTDSLADVRDKINNANSGSNPTGVTASIVNYGTNNYRLLLTSDDTGEDGISLLNASATDILGNLGFSETASGSYEVKNSITGGAQSDRFTSVSTSIEDLLDLNNAQSSTTQLTIEAIDGTSDAISIDLATDDLYDIRDAINNAAGSTSLNASVVSETVSGTTYYRLQIDGIADTDPFSDENNIFQTLGLIKGGVGNVLGIAGTNEMTTNGQAITASTVLADIDGYLEWTSGDRIQFTGKDTDNGSVDYWFNITSTTTVQDLLTALENEYGDVTASVTGDGKIQIVDNSTSQSSSLNVTLADDVDKGSLDFGISNQDAGVVRNREVVQGQDATILVDGVSITSPDNSVEDVLPGVTLNLLKADAATTITLNIDRDIDAIIDTVSTFVEAYNEVASYIHEQQSYDPDEQKTGGVLFGDGTLSSVKSDLTSILVNSVWGVSSDFAIPGLVGVNLDSEGQLSIDRDTLQGYLETNFNDVKLLFSANGTASVGTLEYVSHAYDTQAGEYTVNITQAATQSTTTSNTAVSGTVGSDEILTITEGDKTATISLTSDMTITDIINAVNAELDTVYTEKLVGSTAVTASGSPITSATTWTNIDGGQLVNGDIIAFTGTSRTGSSISGSYTISDISADTVQGLLSAIESAYGNGVIASIDSSGHIDITDKYTGNSQLSLSFDYSQTQNQVDIFGTVLTTNTGGQEGRYVFEITASNDGSDHLTLTHDNYGSNYSFTISETADLLWTDGDQTVSNGVDVTGTINGEAATGSGQVLTGDDGEANVDGLVVKYTGTSTGDLGTIKLTLGAAELFDRALYNMTDDYEGYIAFKQDSLQDRVEDFEDQIKEMEARLDRKMEQMINRFVAMEIALSKIKNQSEWLAGQINATFSGWKWW